MYTSIKTPCPLCGSTGTQALCDKDGHPIWRCPECATDFVSPAPDQATLQAYYDRADWFEGGEPGGYADYDRQTLPLLPFFENILDTFGPSGEGRSVLDVGCGYGMHLDQAHRRGWKCFGVEVSAHARKVASERHGYKFFIVDDMEQLVPHAFDLVVLFDVIEHLANPSGLFYTLFAKGAITPETTVVITTPNARSFSAIANPASWAYRHPPSHLVYFSAQSLVTWLRQLRFRTIEVQGQHEEAAGMTASYPDEQFPLNDPMAIYSGLLAKASGSDFGSFMQERYVPGTWSKLAEYEHLPRYLFAQVLADGRKVLDFGCGTGYGTAILARQAQSVTGIDIDAEALEWARGHHRAANLAFEQWTDLGASQPDASFGLIICFEMIEHVAETTQVEAVRNFARLLEDDGLALISTPNPEITQLYGANPYHIREMDKREFEGLLREHFRYVELFEQSIQPSVLISPTQAGGQTTKIGSLNWDADSLGERQPAIFIAACSQSPIRRLDEYCFQDFGSHYIADQLRTEKALNTARFQHLEAAEQAAAVPILQAALTEKEQTLGKKDFELHQQADEIHRLEDALEEKGQALSTQAAEIHKLDDVLADKDRAITEQAAEMHRLYDVLADKDCALVEQAAEMHQLYEVLADKDHALSGQATEIHRLYAALADKDQALTGHAEEIHRLYGVLTDKDQALTGQAAEIHRLDGILADKAEALAIQAGEIHHLYEIMKYKEQAIAELDRALRHSTATEAEQAAELSRLGQHLAERERELEERERELTLLKQGSWHKLGVAIKQRGVGLRKFIIVPYRLAACLVPRRLKPRLYPIVVFLNQPVFQKRPARPGAPPKKAKRRRQSTKPRVLHVIANFMLGGSSRLVVDLIEGLGDTYEHLVVTSYAPYPPAYADIDVTEFGHPVAEDKVMEFLLEYDPQIVHVHYWGDCDWWWYDLFFRAIKNLKCRVIENVNTPVEPYRADFIDRYVHVSQYVEHEFGDGSELNMTIYPGSDFSHFCRHPDSPLPTDCIGMVYRLEPDKLNEQSIDVFIKVVRQRPQTKAIIVGGGTYLETYRQAVQAAQVEGNFEFTGYVDYSELPRMYERMTVFVAPVWKESFGQVSPFAMNMGIPVTGYQVGGIAEIVDDASLLATPGNSDELAEIVTQLLDDPQRCQEIGTRNHARAQAVFSVNAMTNAYRKLYAEVAGILK